MFKMSDTDSNSQFRVVLIRAGSTEFDDQGRILGSLDLPLSEKGRAEAQALAEQLDSLGIETVISASTQASCETATAIAERNKLKAKVEPKFTNLDCGLWHGRGIEELRETQPSLFKQWKESPETVCPPEGETVSEVKSRIEAVVKRILRKHKKGVLAIVAPEPLLGIIHQEIQTPVDGEAITQIKCGHWKVIEPLVLVK